MTREEKLAKIKEVIGTTESKRNELVIHAVNQFGMNKAGPIMQGIVSKFDELCGPKTMIGYVLDYIGIERLDIFISSDILGSPSIDACEKTQNLDKIIYLRKDKRKSIDEQTDECIDFIYLLIQDG